MGREAGLTKLGRQIPLGAVGEPDDVAWTAVCLASDEAKMVTGHGLHVDGGISAMQYQGSLTKTDGEEPPVAGALGPRPHFVDRRSSRTI